jgi:hypothetical protein
MTPPLVASPETQPTSTSLVQPRAPSSPHRYLLSFFQPCNHFTATSFLLAAFYALHFPSLFYLILFSIRLSCSFSHVLIRISTRYAVAWEADGVMRVTGDMMRQPEVQEGLWYILRHHV